MDQKLAEILVARLLISTRRGLPPVVTCRGTKPSRAAAKSRPRAKLSPWPMAAISAVAFDTPIPGMVMRRRAASSLRTHSASSLSSSAMRRSNLAQVVRGFFAYHARRPTSRHCAPSITTSRSHGCARYSAAARRIARRGSGSRRSHPTISRSQQPFIRGRRGIALCRHTPKVGAACGNSARAVLCGGRSVTTVSTANTPIPHLNCECPNTAPDRARLPRKCCGANLARPGHILGAWGSRGMQSGSGARGKPCGRGCLGGRGATQRT